MADLVAAIVGGLIPFVIIVHAFMLPTSGSDPLLFTPALLLHLLDSERLCNTCKFLSSSYSAVQHVSFAFFSMANAAASANAAAVAWIQYGLYDEFGEEKDKVGSEEERQAVAKELRERWSNIPARYKQIVGPLLCERSQAIARTKEVLDILDKLPDPISLEEYNSAEAGEDLRRAAQYRPSYDEHLQACKDVRDAEAWLLRVTTDLRNALALWEPKGFISRDRLEALTEPINECRKEYRHHIERYDELLEAREENLAAEQKAKALHLRNGEPLDAGWVGQWVLGEGAFGKASLFVRQDRRGVIVDVSLQSRLQTI